MNKYLLSALIIGVTSVLQAQFTISDCEGAIELCGDFYEEDQATLNTGSVYEFTGNCNMNLEQSSVWYTFTAQTNGVLNFVLDPNDIYDDYDWGLFDITNGGCAGLGTTSPEVSCSSWGSFSINGATGISSALGGIGNSNGPGDLNGPPFNGDLPVIAGHTFALVVMNWTNSLEGYSIDFGGSTATLYDDVPPLPVSVDVDCTNTGITIVFSEPILTSSVQNLDFQINGPGGSVTILSAGPEEPGAEADDTFILAFDGQVSTIGNYTLTITTESGLVEDACGNLGEGSINFELVNPLSFETEIKTACNGTGGSIELLSVNGGVSPIVFRVDGIVHSDGLADNLNTGTYTASVTDNTGCVLSEELEVPDHLISISIPLQDTVSCLNPVVQITGLAIAPDQPVAFSWTSESGSGIQSGANTASPSVVEPGTYLVTATHLPSGCSISDQAVIEAGEVQGIDVSMIVFPNVLTSNSDGKNDYWAPFLADNRELDLTSILDTYELQVFNRWGALVFESTESKKIWNASEVNGGVYHYVLKYESTCGTTAGGVKEGYIQVMK